MDALVLDLVVQVMAALGVVFLGWGAWLCLAATPQERASGVSEPATPVLS